MNLALTPLRLSYELWSREDVESLSPYATLAMENLNNTPLYGKLIRVAWSQHDPVARRSGVGNVFVKNLDESIHYVELYDIFSSSGKILSCKVAMTPEGTSKGFGFVQFETEESSKRAIAELHGITVAGKKIYVAPFVRKSERESSSSSAPGILRFTNVYIKHLDPEITKEILEEKISKFGCIKKLVILIVVLYIHQCLGRVYVTQQAIVCESRREEGREACQVENAVSTKSCSYDSFSRNCCFC